MFACEHVCMCECTTVIALSYQVGHWNRIHVFRLGGKHLHHWAISSVQRRDGLQGQEIICAGNKDTPSSCQPLQRLWQNGGVFVVMVKTLLWGWSQFSPLTLSSPLNHSPVSPLFLFALNIRAASTQLSFGSKIPRQCPEATAAPARQSLFHLTRGEGPVSISQRGPWQLTVEGRLIWTM